jgi:hypothetical protein
VRDDGWTGTRASEGRSLQYCIIRIIISSSGPRGFSCAPLQRDEGRDGKGEREGANKRFDGEGEVFEARVLIISI